VPGREEKREIFINKIEKRWWPTTMYRRLKAKVNLPFLFAGWQNFSSSFGTLWVDVVCIDPGSAAAVWAWRWVAGYILCVPKDFRESAAVDPLAGEEYIGP
jgi:hypothetical protein